MLNLIGFPMVGTTIPRSNIVFGGLLLLKPAIEGLGVAAVVQFVPLLNCTNRRCDIKIAGSNTPISIVRATVGCLVKRADEVAALRGIPVF